MRFSTVLFDLDGTLIDSLPDLAASVNLTRKEFGYKDLPLGTVRSFIGDGMLNLVQRCFPDRDPYRILPAFRKHYDANLVERTTAYEGVEEGLKRLQVAGVRLAVLTNKLQQPAEEVLGGLGLADYFELIVGGDGPGGLKPDPGPFEYVLKEMGLGKEGVLMVGDAHPDILGARNVQLPVCGVLYGIGLPERVRELEPDFFAETFAEVVELILG